MGGGEPAAPARPDPEPLLLHLVAVGLATEDRTGPDDDDPYLTCHDLVRERIRTWMRDHEQDRAKLTENTIRLAYAERLEAAFDALQHQDMTAALQAGSRALVYCVQAGAWDRLGGFASGSLQVPAILACWRACSLTWKSPPSPPRRARPRWSCLSYLADAMRKQADPMRACPSTSRPPARPAPPPRPAVKTRARHGRISPGSPATGRMLFGYR